MHYTIDYSQILDEADKRAKAIADIKHYIGDSQYANVTRMAKFERDAGLLTRKSFIIQLEMFAGVRGYAAEAWADELCLVDPN